MFYIAFDLSNFQRLILGQSMPKLSTRQHTIPWCSGLLGPDIFPASLSSDLMGWCSEASPFMGRGMHLLPSRLFSSWLFCKIHLTPTSSARFSVEVIGKVGETSYNSGGQVSDAPLGGSVLSGSRSPRQPATYLPEQVLPVSVFGHLLLIMCVWWHQSSLKCWFLF